MYGLMLTSINGADYDGEQLQLILTNGTVMIIHSRDCILYNGTLPTAEKH